MNKQPIGIIGAMPEEVKTLTERLDNPQTITTAGMTLVSGSIHHTAVVVMQCGIGKVNAALGATLMIERFMPKAIINTGSAGGLGKSLSVGDVVIGHQVAHHDVDVTAFGYEPGQMAGMPKTYPSDKHLITATETAAQSFPGATVHQGQIVSGDSFVCSAEVFGHIRQVFPKALAVEMEAAAIAQVCYRYQIPFVVVRAISDLADEAAGQSFEDFIEQAGKHSADMVMQMLPLITSIKQ